MPAMDVCGYSALDGSQLNRSAKPWFSDPSGRRVSHSRKTGVKRNPEELACKTAIVTSVRQVCYTVMRIPGEATLRFFGGRTICSKKLSHHNALTIVDSADLMSQPYVPPS